MDPREYELEEQVIHIGRIAKVVKGGKRFRFSAWVVVGDRNSVVGFGHGKANEVPYAIQKAIQDARRKLLKVPRVGSTVAHSVFSRHKSCKVLIKPAAPGTGIIANDKLRAIFELGGIRDVLTKCLGSNNSFNNVIAAYKGLLNMRKPEEFAELRGKSVGEILKGRRRVEEKKDREEKEKVEEEKVKEEKEEVEEKKKIEEDKVEDKKEEEKAEKKEKIEEEIIEEEENVEDKTDKK